MGPKKAVILHRELGIDSLAALQSACESGAVRKLKGFGAKTEAAILEGLAFAATTQERIYWATADRMVQSILAHMRQCPALERIEAAGSYRRGRETIGDLDFLVISRDANQVFDHLEQYPDRIETIARGEEKKMSIRLRGGLQVDMRIMQAHQFGAALQYFTGSKEHNVRVRHLAKKNGLRINEYGVFPEGSETAIAGETEAEVYAAVGLPWIPPELREDRHEFQWRESQNLPKLITREDLIGDLHMHTHATDGEASIEEMADAAIAQGLKYIVITDHSQRVSMARGLNSARLIEQWQQIDRLRKAYAGRLEIYKGIECDILEDATMDLPDEVLALADWVVASLHYGQRQSRTQITDRLLMAARHPHVDCLGHPTGRLIQKRPAYEVDLDAVLQACAEHHTCVELNANPARLDLDDVQCAAAKRLGIPIVISSDAHSTDGFEVLRYGINQARRAALSPDDVFNTKPFRQRK